MLTNATAENVLGTIGTFLWAFQITPQIWKSWREKSTEGLSAWLMFIWAFGGMFLGVYVIVQNINIPLIVQPQLFSNLAAFSWIQCLYYGNKRSFRFCAITFAVFVCMFAGLEAGFVYALRPSVRRGETRGLHFFGIFSAVTISAGLIPQYIEIWKRREVIGISLLFMAIDILGGVFSLLSLIFKPKFDTVASLTYLAVIVLDGVVVIAALILNPIARRRRAREALPIPSQAGTLEEGHRPPEPPELITEKTEPQGP